MDNPVVLILVLIPSVILHEVAHGVVALWFGDDTAKQAGRLTLNPVAHVDLFGTIILPAMLAIAGGTVFGYAKPVPTRPGRMRDPRNHGMWTSLAGPATNILIAVLAAMAIRMSPLTLDGTLGEVLLLVGVINVILAAFNLIPLPPLDGSAVVQRFLPERLLPGWFKLRRYSMWLVLGVVLLVPGALAVVFEAAVTLWVGLL